MRIRLRTQNLVILSLALASTSIVARAAPLDFPRAEPQKSCSRAQEYITTMEFLRSNAEWAIEEKDMQTIARRISRHCPGSAARFIQVGRILSEAGMSGRDSVKTAIQYAERDDDRSKRFIALFKNLYLEDRLDLDLRTSVTLSNELSAEFDGALTGVEQEFSRLAEFCVLDTGLAQSRPRCARFAADIIQSAKDQPSGVFVRWKKAFDFLVSGSGAKLTTAAAATLASEIVATGDVGTESFVQAYRYAVSPQGLKLDRGRALDFSKQLVVADLRSDSGKASTPKPSTRRKPNPQEDLTISTASRTPAQVDPRKSP